MKCNILEAVNGVNPGYLILTACSVCILFILSSLALLPLFQPTCWPDFKLQFNLIKEKISRQHQMALMQLCFLTKTKLNSVSLSNARNALSINDHPLMFSVLFSWDLCVRASLARPILLPSLSASALPTASPKDTKTFTKCTQINTSTINCSAYPFDLDGSTDLSLKQRLLCCYFSYLTAIGTSNFSEVWQSGYRPPTWSRDV